MTDKHVERRLAAILAADVVGFSRLMALDEEGTLTRLKAHRRGLIDPKTSEHHGRVINTMGDGMLIEFASAVDAARCAVAIQRAGAELAGDIVLRIGINLGNVIVDEGDLYGDGVNVAARLEALAEPGTIYVSGSVYDQIRGKVEVPFDDLDRRLGQALCRPA